MEISDDAKRHLEGLLLALPKGVEVQITEIAGSAEHAEEHGPNTLDPRAPPPTSDLLAKVERRLSKDCECGHPHEEHYHEACEVDGCECERPDVVDLFEQDTALLGEIREALLAIIGRA